MVRVRGVDPDVEGSSSRGGTQQWLGAGAGGVEIARYAPRHAPRVWRRRGSTPHVRLFRSYAGSQPVPAVSLPGVGPRRGSSGGVALGQYGCTQFGRSRKSARKYLISQLFVRARCAITFRGSARAPQCTTVP
eukprot:6948435-Prymnesium_polylepis.2